MRRQNKAVERYAARRGEVHRRRSGMMMKTEFQELADVVDEVIKLLAFREVGAWPDNLRRINDRIRNEWDEGPKLLLELFGGMGSLNDIYICPENNQKISPGEVKSVNQELNRLLSRAYELANELTKMK